MSISDHKDPANVPTTMTTGPVDKNNPAHISNKAGEADSTESTERKRGEQIADELAHQGAKAEQTYDKENSNLFNK
jgi:hypothetical protein